MRKLFLAAVVLLLAAPAYNLSTYDVEVKSLTCTGTPCGSGSSGLTNGDKGEIILSGSPAGSQWDIDTGAVGTAEAAALDTADVTTGTWADARVDGSLEADEVNPTLGTQTQGNYVDNVTGDTEIVVTHTPGEGSEPALAIAASITRDSEAAAAYQPISTELSNLVNNCVVSNTATPIPDACVGDGTDGGGGNQSVTLGPFYINDLAGTATTQATLGFFNTATALSRNANADVAIQAAAHVVGLFISSDAARTAGTATARVRIAASGTTFNGGAVALDATNTRSDSSMVAHASGLAVTTGQTVGCDVVTSGWTPVTADIACWVVVSYD